LDQSGCELRNEHEDLEISGIVPFSPFPKPFHRPSQLHSKVESDSTFKVPQNPVSIVSDPLKGQSTKPLRHSSCPDHQLYSTPTMVRCHTPVSEVPTGTPSGKGLLMKDDDFIWYQASAIIKGYAEKESKDI